MRTYLVQGLSVLLLILAIFWFIFDPGFEPVITAIAGLVGLFSGEFMKRPGPGSQLTGTARADGESGPALSPPPSQFSLSHPVDHLSPGVTGVTEPEAESPLPQESRDVDTDPPPHRPTIAVLPLDNMSPDPADAYFSSGLTEEITAQLSTFSGLRVISRTSATQLKSSDRDVRSFAMELGIDYLLEGSVRMAGDQIRVTAQFIDAKADSHVWARKYGGTLTDVFEIQEEVARSVVEALRVELTPEEEDSLSTIAIEDIRAYEFFLKARDQIHRFTPEALDLAVKYLEEARKVVGDRAPILSGLAYAYAQYVNLGEAQEESIRLAEGFARQAVELDQTSAEALTVLGFMSLAFEGRAASSIQYLERALQRRPDDPNALMWAAVAHAHVGKIKQGRAYAARFLEVDPLTGSHILPGTVELYAGRYEEALGYMERGLDEDPANPFVQAFFCLGLFFCRQFDRLISFVEERVEKGQQTSPHLIMDLLVSAANHQVEEMHRLLEPSEAWATFRRDSQYSWFAACAFAHTGDLDAALDWITNSVERGLENCGVLTDPNSPLAALKEETRFNALTRRICPGPKSEGPEVQ